MARACSPSYSEAEAGELLKPRSSRLQRAMIAPLYSSLGDRVRLFLKKKKREREKRKKKNKVQGQSSRLSSSMGTEGKIVPTQ